MQYGLFTMPSHPPERGLYEGHRWDLETLRWADELGFSEAWIGEHHTAPWEPHPAPDLLIAQSLGSPLAATPKLSLPCAIWSSIATRWASSAGW